MLTLDLQESFKNINKCKLRKQSYKLVDLSGMFVLPKRNEMKIKEICLG